MMLVSLWHVWVCSKEKRDVTRSMKYVELMMVADHAEVKAQPGANVVNIIWTKTQYLMHTCSTGI